jgi:NAD+--asparagine ADP-ribosyltransferase
MKPRIHPKTLSLKEVSGTSVLVEWNKSSISYVYESFVLIDRVRDQKKIFRIIPDQKKKHWYQFSTDIYFNGGLDILFDP